MEERLNAIIRLAFKYHANDIHFENGDVFVRVRDRLFKIRRLDLDIKLFEYLSYLANFDLGKLTPQTKQFELDVDGIKHNFRYATCNNWGVLRLLD